jgi:hypothetical protein
MKPPFPHCSPREMKPRNWPMRDTSLFFWVLGPRSSLLTNIAAGAILMIILCRMFSEVGSSLRSRGSVKCVV